MAHKRTLVPAHFASGEALTADLVAIGMRFAAKASLIEPNIEDTIVAASLEGIEQEDYRLLSLLVDWFEVHVERVNADRLTKVVKGLGNARVRAFWAALARWQKRDTRLKRLQRVYRKSRVDLMGDGTAFQIERNGEDERFVGTCLRVPLKLLRHRPEDIFSPYELAERHRAYYFRVMMGPSYRADMWAWVEREPQLTPAEIARRTYGSFPTAWEVKRNWGILNRGRVLAAVS